jgi:hypothetical protein
MSSKSFDKFKIRFKARRFELGYVKQADLGKKIWPGISLSGAQSKISRIERGQLPDDEDWEAIVKVMGFSRDYFLYGVEGKQNEIVQEEQDLDKTDLMRMRDEIAYLRGRIDQMQMERAISSNPLQAGMNQSQRSKKLVSR